MKSLDRSKPKRQMGLKDQSILCINLGSSSLKLALFEASNLKLQAREKKKKKDTHFELKDDLNHSIYHQALPDNAFDNWWQCLFAYLAKNDIRLLASGHRVVHGGPYTQPVRMSEDNLQALEGLIPFAPFHQGENLKGIKKMLSFDAELLQIACFDTSFHETMPRKEKQYAIPERFYDQGIQKYGFHGLSFESILRQLNDTEPSLIGKRLVIAHLGSGSSLCAVKSGKSVATTMGLTPLDGLIMATRAGKFDPALILNLLKQGYELAEIETIVFQESGLKALAGEADMKRLLERTDTKAQQALEHYVYSIQQHLALMVAALGGIDGLIFTGGIGEHAKTIWYTVCQEASWLGIRLREIDSTKLPCHISAEESEVDVWVLKSQEERIIAEHTKKLALQAC
ncbi:MAG: acetate/propionate family kinase [Trueperaceae bacterium]|nr:acetate/propionate family kinase [Trueperaceae bacterium]